MPNGKSCLIETCKQMGISFRDYFRRVMKELQAGRGDYENLLPQTIGLKSINIKNRAPKFWQMSSGICPKWCVSGFGRLRNFYLVE